jgi:hypothetical protein
MTGPQATQTTIVHLIGNPAVGKYTIGKELARTTGARLVDNHSIANVIFNVIGADGVTPLPKEVWPYVLQVRRAALDALIHVAPPSLSFVLTNYLRGEDPAETAAFEELVAVAEVRGSVFVPVILSCATEEIRRRTPSPSRVERMKLINPQEAARMNDEGAGFETDHPNLLRLDTTSVPPEESARRIAAWAAECVVRAGR